MSILTPHNDTLITMARLVFEQSELNFLDASFSVSDEEIVVQVHDDEKGTRYIYERVSIAKLVASYIGLGLVTDLDANDAVTTGHRLGNTGR
ncbi:hypothetical protein NVP1081O_275 [Vibrio phage 1.081.O._10N.286.52.C2]|nr:hypothetical protein NVP1081O_275 [Vibrio phage 1.081.O._10N.286.52.C2]